MSNNNIRSNELTPGAFIVVEGEVEYSRLTRFLTEEELRQDQANRRNRGMIAIDKNYLTITINNARIVPSQASGQLTREEQYIAERFYTTQRTPGVHYSIISKSNIFPRFLQVKINDDGSIDKTHLEEKGANGELAQGLKVALMLRVFKPQNLSNRGIALDAVIAQEPIRYYQSGGAVNHLAAMGIIVDQLSEEERRKAQAHAMPAAPASADPTAMSDIPVTQPVTPPIGNPYSSAAQANPIGMTPPVQNVPENDEWTCPTCGTVNKGKFCMNCAAPKPVQMAGGNPYAQADVASMTNPSGIRFDPNDNNRNY